MNKEEWRMQRTNPSRLQTGLRRLRLDWVLYALLLPTLVYFVIFRVIPIWNMRLAFYNSAVAAPGHGRDSNTLR